ncbi:FAD/NAD-P-binding domain-containing protein [Auriscalpium vulgare]|uniref:FAD/NAD-P-binding domain-containing protein n=1 Tax=Auriscalpium vulgare TaxID=40419 RepID=A0ACB8S0M2_9AGAM|nr:FAD/NAD-P-binding domain-containing protein [Auriscalpium vulgare]
MTVSSTGKPNIVVIGGSYVGTKTADFIAQKLHQTHNTVLIEKNTHFQHLFAFPRYAVVPGYEHMAFVPFTAMYAHLPEGAVSVVQARAAAVHPDKVELANGESLPYEYLVLATGTRLSPPGTLHTEGKQDGIAYFQQHQKQIAQAQKIVVVGGGAVGVQMSTDIKDYYPSKSVTLVHSRDRLMNNFHPRLNEIILERAKELGIEVVLDDRVVVPADGFPLDGSEFDVKLRSGRTLTADFVILATGQTPLSEPLRSLSASVIGPKGFVSVKPTLQIADDAFPNVFAVGDVADTTNQKAARPGSKHAEVVAENIAALVAGHGATTTYEPAGFGIHMSLGLVSASCQIGSVCDLCHAQTRSLRFRNPSSETADPMVNLADDGHRDGGSGRIWKMKAPGITDYYL